MKAGIRRAGAASGMRRGGLLRLATAAACAVVLGACAAVGLQSPQVAFYDLGLVEPAGVPAALAPLRVDVVAPGWLSGSAMQYRLGWKQPDRRRSYVESRWAAPPADMLAQAFGRALRTGGEGAVSRCRLKLELDEFIQAFDSEDDSHLHLVLRAQLLPPRGEVPLAVREFGRREKAGTADAEGGAAAARAAVRAVAADLAGWLEALDRRAGQGLNSAGHCAPA